ncbi:MAG: efflux RND transporter periplasmic adaptor subunit [Deltaproteobacteria bacterium]
MRKTLIPLLLLMPILFFLSACFAGQTQGITEAYQDSTMSSVIAGIVSQIRVNEGEPVKQGDIILELVHDEQSLLVENTKTDYERNLRLYEKNNSVSTEELQKKELDYKLAQVELEKRLIRAPFDGIVTKFYRHVGEYSDPQQPLLRIVNIRKCRFIGYLDREAGKLEKGAKTRINIGQSNGPEYEGEVEFISPVVDASSGLREVKILFDNTEKPVTPGVVGFLLEKADDGTR